MSSVKEKEETQREDSDVRTIKQVAYDAALQFVNQERMLLGLEPLGWLQKGYVSSPSHCPIARSMNYCNDKVQASVFSNNMRLLNKPVDTLGILEGGYSYKCVNYRDTAVSAFIEMFDRGSYPELMQ